MIIMAVAKSAPITIVDPANDGATLRTIDDPMRAYVIREFVRFECGRQVQCPYTREIMDCRHAVAILDTDDQVQAVLSPGAYRLLVTSPDAWPKVVEAYGAGIGVFSDAKRSLKVA